MEPIGILGFATPKLFVFVGIALAMLLCLRSNVVVSTGLLEKGLRSEFLNRFNGVPTEYQNLATRIPSNAESETYRWLGTVPTMREWVNGRLAKGLRTESYSVRNLKYEATIEVDRDEMSDDQTGQIPIRIGEMALRAATHKDFLLAQLLINGGAAGFNAYDGLTFFNANHISGASGAQSNNLGPAAVNPNAPTVAEWKAAYSAAVAAMMTYRDDQGEPMSVSAGGLVAVVPWSQAQVAMEALQATMLNNSSNILTASARVLAWPWITAANVWYLLKTDGVVRPFVFQDREPIEFASVAEGSEEGFKREKYLYGVRARYRMTYGYWQYAVRNTFQ